MAAPINPSGRLMKPTSVSTLLLLIVVLLSNRAAYAAPIRIAYSSISGAMLPLWVAKDKGLFDKHGVDVELTYIRGVSIEALLAGEVQLSAPRRPRWCEPHCGGPILRLSPTPSTLRCFP